jgi:hypothetical protein
MMECPIGKQFPRNSSLNSATSPYLTYPPVWAGTTALFSFPSCLFKHASFPAWVSIGTKYSLLNLLGTPATTQLVDLFCTRLCYLQQIFNHKSPLQLRHRPHACYLPSKTGLSGRCGIRRALFPPFHLTFFVWPALFSNIPSALVALAFCFTFFFSFPFFFIASKSSSKIERSCPLLALKVKFVVSNKLLNSDGLNECSGHQYVEGDAQSTLPLPQQTKHT